MQLLDLDCLAKAAKILGLEFRKGQKAYRWWGHSVGDWPIPQGFTAKDLGHCEHALSIPNNNTAYEVGIVKRRDGKPGWTMLWDFYGGGRGLQEKIGKDGCKLIQEYAAQVATKHFQNLGLNVERIVAKSGKIKVVGKGKAKVAATTAW